MKRVRCGESQTSPPTCQITERTEGKIQGIYESAERLAQMRAAFELNSGIQFIETEVSEAVCSAKPNGWACLALIHGLKEVPNKLATTLDTVAIISGLLLSASLGLLVAFPNEAFGRMNIREQVSYILCVSLSVVLHFLSIAAATFFFLCRSFQQLCKRCRPLQIGRPEWWIAINSQLHLERRKCVSKCWLSFTTCKNGWVGLCIVLFAYS
jgi:hypothetical protein